MTCYHPLAAYQRSDSDGKCRISFAKCSASTPISLPCGQCVGCRLERSRQWAIRCINEASLYEDNCFITLTYNDENLPWDHSLNKGHFQKFMKRFRKEYNDKKIRYYHCGEYGKATPDNDFIARPHYHAIIFNHDFKDKIHHSTRNGNNLYTSIKLGDIWNKGFASIGTVTFESAAYCARYILKKVNGKNAKEHYTRTDYTTGEIINLQPEYTTMSRGAREGIGGIGKGWLDKFRDDVFRDDFIVSSGGLIIKPPKYYDTFNPDIKQTKETRIEKMSKNKKDLTPERLHDREVCQLAKIKQLTREL